jgi:hypothetical protein
VLICTPQVIIIIIIIIMLPNQAIASTPSTPQVMCVLARPLVLLQS